MKTYWMVWCSSTRGYTFFWVMTVSRLFFIFYLQWQVCHATLCRLSCLLGIWFCVICASFFTIFVTLSGVSDTGQLDIVTWQWRLRNNRQEYSEFVGKFWKAKCCNQGLWWCWFKKYKITTTTTTNWRSRLGFSSYIIYWKETNFNTCLLMVS